MQHRTIPPARQNKKQSMKSEEFTLDRAKVWNSFESTEYTQEHSGLNNGDFQEVWNHPDSSCLQKHLFITGQCV